ncbi:MAG: tetratricopeptide repeat protein [Verrucomicrobiales bacterium]
MFKLQLTLMLFCACSIGAAPLPIDPIWSTESFRKAFTASYGIDSRIEPKLTPEEKEELDLVAKKMSTGDRPGAISLMTKSSLLEKSPAMLFNLGSLHFEEGESAKAMNNFRKALKIQPNFRDAHRNLAIAHVQAGDYIKAEPSLRRAMELGSQDGLTMGLLGYCLSQSGRSHDALQAYRMAKLTMPDELQWQLGEATALMELNELEEAESIYKYVLKVSPERVGIWANLANVNLRQGNQILAISNMEVARRLNALDSSSLLSLGHLYLNETLTEKAMDCYRQALKDPIPFPLQQFADAVDYLLQYQFWDQARKFVLEIKEAAGYDERAKEDSKAAHQFERAEAMIEIELGDSEVGVARLESMLKKDPLDGLILVSLAEYFLENKETEKALMFLERAASVDEFAVQAQRRRGEILALRGDYVAALDALKNAQEIEPHRALEKYIESIERLSKLYDRQ